MAIYKPGGVWQFEEHESEEGREPGEEAELTTDFRTEEPESDAVAAAD